MFKDLIGKLIIASLKASSGIIRKKEIEEYAKLKTKAGTTESPADDVLVELLGVLIGAED